MQSRGAVYCGRTWAGFCFVDEPQRSDGTCRRNQPAVSLKKPWCAMIRVCNDENLCKEWMLSSWCFEEWICRSEFVAAMLATKNSWSSSFKTSFLTVQARGTTQFSMFMERSGQEMTSLERGAAQSCRGWALRGVQTFIIYTVHLFVFHLKDHCVILCAHWSRKC